MLTTEKLFRGDTEFALMEKVRKADVPPPSKFNRRVTPELDAICLKALARDVGDRYQTGQELATELEKLLGAYRFQPSELQEFVRGLFRADFVKEDEDVVHCRTSVPLDQRPATAAERDRADTPPIGVPVTTSDSDSGLRSSEAPVTLEEERAPADLPSSSGPLPTQADEADKRGGLWSKIKSRFSK
jgi:hypothetical protein